MTIPLEFTGSSDAVQRNFDALAALVPDVGARGVQIRYGTATVTVTASNFGTLTVTHGLGVVPASVHGTSQDFAYEVAADTWTTTTFRLIVRHVDNVAATTTVTASWLAIG